MRGGKSFPNFVHAFKILLDLTYIALPHSPSVKLTRRSPKSMGTKVYSIYREGSRARRARKWRMVSKHYTLLISHSQKLCTQDIINIISQSPFWIWENRPQKHSYLCKFSTDDKEQSKLNLKTVPLRNACSFPCTSPYRVRSQEGSTLCRAQPMVRKMQDNIL